MSKIPDDDLLNDIMRVANKLEKSPTQIEYRTHGEYGVTTIRNRFGSWNNGLAASGHTRNTAHGLSDETLLRHLRDRFENAETTSSKEFFHDKLDYGETIYLHRFGGRWRSIVRAGYDPPAAVPISESDYDSYIQTAIDAEYPSVSLLGLLRAFTGFPQGVLNEVSPDWVSRLDSDLQPTLITVPSDHIAGDDNWVAKAPTHYTVAGKTKESGLEPLLRWLDDTDGNLLTIAQAKHGILSNLITEAGLDIGPPSLRATVAAHLARRSVSKFEIEMQVGFEKTNWDRSVEDYFLYLYQFEDYCHPDYDPSGVYLDPDSGEPRRIESEATEPPESSVRRRLHTCDDTSDLDVAQHVAQAGG